MEPGIPEQKIGEKTSRMAHHVSRNIYGRSFPWSFPWFRRGRDMFHGQERALLVLSGRTV
jgi:hypothetical protein